MSSDEEKENCLARVEWLLVTSRTHRQTDKCKISILIWSIRRDIWSIRRTLDYNSKNRRCNCDVLQQIRYYYAYAQRVYQALNEPGRLTCLRFTDLILRTHYYIFVQMW